MASARGFELDLSRQHLKIFPLTRDEPESPLYPLYARCALKILVWEAKSHKAEPKGKSRRSKF